MSQRHAVQDATGVIAVDETGDILIAAGKAKPDSASGYAPGCLFINTEAGEVYVNAGDSTSSTFGSALT